MAMTFNRGVTRDAVNDFSCRFSDLVFGADVMSASSPTEITVPEICAMGSVCTDSMDFLAVFKVQDDRVVVAAVNQVATINTSSSFVAVTGEMISPGMGRVVRAGDTISFATEEVAATVTVSFYILS